MNWRGRISRKRQNAGVDTAELACDTQGMPDTLTIRLAREEEALLQSAAEKQGVTLRQFVRRCALDAARHVGSNLFPVLSHLAGSVDGPGNASRRPKQAFVEAMKKKHGHRR